MQITAPEAANLADAIRSVPGTADVDVDALIAALLPQMSTIVTNRLAADRVTVLDQIGQMRATLNRQFDDMQETRRSEIDALIADASAPQRPGC